MTATPLVDLAVTVGNGGKVTYGTGEPGAYTVTVTNNGPITSGGTVTQGALRAWVSLALLSFNPPLVAVSLIVQTERLPEMASRSRTYRQPGKWCYDLHRFWHNASERWARLSTPTSVAPTEEYRQQSVQQLRRQTPVATKQNARPSETTTSTIGTLIKNTDPQ